MANEQLNNRHRRVRWIWTAAVAVTAAAILWALVPRATEADFVTIDQGDVRVELVDEGRTRMHDIYVVSAPVSGRVLRVEVEPGDIVKAGAVIARMTQAAAGFLDTRTDMQARAAIDAAAAQLRAAGTELALATRDDERTRSLAEQKLVSAAAVDSSKARMDAARATRDAAAAELARARSALQPAERMAGGNITCARQWPAMLRVPQKSERRSGRRANRGAGRRVAYRGGRRIPVAGRGPHAARAACHHRELGRCPPPPRSIASSPWHGRRSPRWASRSSAST
jgi:multidrug efflux pump subunit AcrA (membrane-fusion protein)